MFNSLYHFILQKQFYFASRIYRQISSDRCVKDKKRVRFFSLLPN